MREIRASDGRVLLRVRSVEPSQPRIETWEHGEIWHGVQRIVIDLGEAHWYGQGGLVHQNYPLEKLAQYPAPFLTSDNGATGLLGILDPFWITSDGAGIRVENDAMTTSFNAPLHGEPPPHSFSSPAPYDQRPKLAAGLETDHALTITGDDLSLRFFTAENARGVVEQFYQQMNLPDPPPLSYLEKPLWTTWAHFKNDISHPKIADYLSQLQAHDFPIGVLGIDAKWQQAFGDSQFDREKFPDPAATADMLHQIGAKVTLWCVPFFSTRSQHYQTAIERDFVLKRQNGQPYVGDWWEGQAIFLDVTNQDAMCWHLDNLSGLAASVGVDGFKFDAGEGMFYTTPDLQSQTTPNHANHRYIEQIAARYPWSDVRSGWKNQSAAMLFRQWDKNSTWGFDNGLASCITSAITLNLLGYPYSFPDMIGGNQYADQVPTAELLIRWTQAVAPMPIMQFSIPPWQFGEECAAICARYAHLHGEIASHARDIQGPIVRPLWWLDPGDEAALVCNDQYLIGDDLLVAPVIVEGARQRDIYLPRGTWQSYWHDNQQLYQGSTWLRDYPAPLDVLPLFRRV